MGHQITSFVALSYFLLLYAAWRGRAVGNPTIMLQGHNEDLHSLLHQLLPVVRKEQVVVRDAVAHWIIGAHHIQQRCEQGQSMSKHKGMRTKLVEHVLL